MASYFLFQIIKKQRFNSKLTLATTSPSPTSFSITDVFTVRRRTPCHSPAFFTTCSQSDRFYPF
ncbi:hypothetical protein SLEP1_g24260 [Rubroshorea leprosula]|uniref:Uncharacterized protein n=1 Tax=Rubroshorea leprosula TaxID=152421 RepID=A0AAV5JR37_9ROSI|nr:hypothetical protein SLEP1_g24260 [Rubroshorea leprosula]